jgi:hypothetical protein
MQVPIKVLAARFDEAIEGSNMFSVCKPEAIDESDRASVVAWFRQFPSIDIP